MVFPPVLDLKLYNLAAPGVSLEPHNCFPYTRAQGEHLRVSEPVCCPSKRTSGLLAAFHLMWMDRMPADFHSQMWGFLFLALVF